MGFPLIKINFPSFLHYQIIPLIRVKLKELMDSSSTNAPVEEQAIIIYELKGIFNILIINFFQNKWHQFEEYTFRS